MAATELWQKKGNKERDEWRRDLKATIKVFKDKFAEYWPEISTNTI